MVDNKNLVAPREPVRTLCKIPTLCRAGQQHFQASLNATSTAQCAEEPTRHKESDEYLYN
jgi:hypothetical protein